MPISYAVSPDSTQIAYDVCGSGPALLLIHGGGTSRRDWHEAGFVDKLRNFFTVITLDLRGHGESDAPVDPAAYSVDRLCQDLLAVADACGAERFSLWGMSYGGKMSRYLAVRPEGVDRLEKLVLMGTPMGLGVSGERRQQAVDFGIKWNPVLLAQREGSLDLDAFSEEDRSFWGAFNVPVMAAWVRAMLDWPEVAPADFFRPTLWVVGAQDTDATITLDQYRDEFAGSLVRVELIEGQDHDQVFDEVEPALTFMLAFTRAE